MNSPYACAPVASSSSWQGVYHWITSAVWRKVIVWWYHFGLPGSSLTQFQISWAEVRASWLSLYCINVSSEILEYTMCAHYIKLQKWKFICTCESDILPNQSTSCHSFLLWKGKKTFADSMWWTCSSSCCICWRRLVPVPSLDLDFFQWNFLYRPLVDAFWASMLAASSRVIEYLGSSGSSGRSR